MSRRVAIHYRRPPDHVSIYDQRVVHEAPDAIITLSDPLVLAEPITVNGDPGLEHGSRALWFTFPGVWHDIGRFHRADGTFTGVYANILTPLVVEGPIWHTTDLWLDVWIRPGEPAVLLDEDEFDVGRLAGHIDEQTARRARNEADRLLALAGRGEWPPPLVQEWTLERALERLGES